VAHRLTVALLVGVALGSSGCVETGRLSPSVERARRESVNLTYEVVDSGLGMEPDGYTFLNERFRFEFDRGFDGVAGYETKDDRLKKGTDASEFLNDGYEFVRDIFGIEASKQLLVVIAPTVRGDADDAYTQTQWMLMGEGGRMIEDSQESVIYFGQAAFEDHTVLAHEMTHALLNAYRLPAWFSEGIAALVEVDYAKSSRTDFGKYTTKPIGLDESGHNVIQTWRGHGSALPERSSETYGSAYAIIREIRMRYGDDVYPLFFGDFKVTKAHLASGDELSLDVIIDTFNRVTGRDVAPFFQEIQFDVEDR